MWIRALILAMTAVAGGAARAADPYDAGMKDFAAGRWADAARNFEASLAERPGRPPVLYMLALAEARAGRIDKAEAAFAEMLSAPTLDPVLLEKGWTNRLRNLIDGGRGGRALALLPAARAAVPQSADLLYQGARAEFEAGRWRAAIALLEEATKLDSEQWAVFNLLGLSWLRSGNPKAARIAFERAATLAPDVAWIHNNLGAAREASGDLLGAEAAYRRALELGASAKVEANLERVRREIARGGGRARWVLEEE